MLSPLWLFGIAAGLLSSSVFVVCFFIALVRSYEEYNGSWYYYAKATNEVGTRYVSTPNIIIDADPAVALEYPSGKELTGKYGQTESGTYWGDLQFTVVDESKFTVKDGSTPLEPDENSVYTIKADMDEGIKHEIVIMDAGNNRTAYINEIRMNTLDRRDNPSALNLPNGANLEESLPKTVRILTARDSSMFTNIPVIWEIPETYEQASKREQSFTVNGTLDLSGTDIVLHPDKTELGKAQISVTIAGAPRYTLTIADSANGSITVVNATETAEDGTPLFCKDDLVMLSIAPNEGYMLSTLSINGTPASFAVEDDTYTFAQPEENVTITATFEKRNEHTITFDANGGSEPEDLPEEVTTAMPAKKVLHGSEYSLPECEFVAPEGKQFKAWEIGGAEYPVNAPVTVTADITVKALWEDAPPAPTEYTVTVTSGGNGTASASPSKAVAGAEITLSATPDKGYHLKEWQVESPTGLVITNNKFTMPDSNVEVKAIFEEDAPPAPTDPAKPSISVTGTYTYNGSEHTATVSGYDPATMDISGNTATDAGDYTVSVTSQTGKWADGSTEAVTAVWSIGKATQEAPDGLSSVAPATEGGSDGKITGVDATMEYRAESEITYTACTGIEIENLSAGNYFVRYAEDHNHFASPDAEVTVGEGAPLADCTITFNAGGGSGSMASVTVKAETNYILPECGFTAPADQEFKAWEIGGTEYKVGDSYTVLGDTEIKALWENSVITPTTYTVTVSNDGNGTGAAVPSTAAAGMEITLTAMPNEGYHFKEWKVISGGVTIKDDKFLMPNDNVEVKAIFEKDAPPAPTEFIVTFDGNGGMPSVGSMTTTNQKLPSLPSASRRGSYSFDGWYTEKSGGTKITTATVFSANTTVYAHWTYIGGYTPPVRPRPAEDVPAKHPGFVDAPVSSYFYEAVMWAVENGVTTGVSASRFDPNGVCTRAQAVTFLWRAAGSPAPRSRTMPFTDVPAGSYYYDAVLWAVENGITKGTSETRFSPDDTCTRAQIVAFLWRSEKSPAAGSRNPFADVKATAYYADAVLWAVREDITKGTTSTTFSPDADCTRAQIVTFLWRCKK